MLKAIIIAVATWATITFAAPSQLGLQFEKRAGALPILTLPYATYRAATYNPSGDV